MSETTPAAPVASSTRDTLRSLLLERTPWWYSPWVHLAFPSLLGLGCIAAAILSIHGLRPVELFAVPLVWVFSNAVEWWAHRDLLHKKTWPLEVLFLRHTPEHHVVYVREDMAIRSAREFRLVLIPFYGILAVLAGTSPVTAALALAGWRNVAALFVATTMGYVVSYEWLHLSYHLPPTSLVGRLGLVGVLRRHHAAHHTPELMQAWNFNVTVPLWDWVRGTIHRAP